MVTPLLTSVFLTLSFLLDPVSGQCTGNVQADMVFILDASGSVGASNFQTMLSFVQDLVNDFDIGSNKVRVGVQKYSDGTNTEFNLNTYYDKNSIINAVANIYYTTGRTNTGGALEYLRTNMFTSGSGDRASVTNIGVLMSDGVSNDDSYTATQAAHARNAGITLFSIGIGSGIPLSELNEIATDPDSDHVFSVSSFSALSGIKSAFQTQACRVVDGAWGSWHSWGGCSVTCMAVGVRDRLRNCDSPAARHGGAPCPGSNTESQSCDYRLTLCDPGNGWAPQVYATTPGTPVHGGFNNWGSWSACSKTCGAGVRVRTRQCNSPVPKYGGDVCTGNYFESETCNNVACSAIQNYVQQHCSGREYFTCESGGQCVHFLKKCDCYQDCADGSDETMDYGGCLTKFQECTNGVAVVRPRLLPTALLSLLITCLLTCLSLWQP